MDRVIELTPAQQMADRPFTDTAHNEQDLAAMRRILSSLGLLLGQPLTWPEPPQHLVVRGDENGKVVRVVVGNRAALLEQTPRFVVGFFGHRRTELDATILNAVDDDLIHEFALHPGVLSYSSFELEDGNYVNLVVLEDEAAKEHWRTSSRHAYAARDLAPEFYASIRLHNAVLPHGLAAAEVLRLVATKYYDYQSEPSWRAVRVVEDGE